MMKRNPPRLQKTAPARAKVRRVVKSMIYAPVSLGLLSRLWVCKFNARPPHPKELVTFEELLRSMMYEQEATRRVLVRKGLLTDDEVLEEVKAVRREMEGKRGR